jgi:hypothetical protein
MLSDMDSTSGLAENRCKGIPAQPKRKNRLYLDWKVDGHQEAPGEDRNHSSRIPMCLPFTLGVYSKVPGVRGKMGSNLSEEEW